jgi:hypothetical protein
VGIANSLPRCLYALLPFVLAWSLQLEACSCFHDSTFTMKKLYLLLLVSVLRLPAIAQFAYWQQEVHYTIDVSLNDTEHTLEGFLKLRYINHSPDTLTYIWFHLWPNAFKNDKTAFSEQTL